MTVTLIGYLRALVEMLGLCLIGQAALALLAGQQRQKNAIYQFLALLTRPPRQLTALLIRRSHDDRNNAIVCFLLLFAMWIGLAMLRKQIV